MPNRDGTGPLGKGPGTGRGLGPCNKGQKTTDLGPCGMVRGTGAGRGRGRNNRNAGKGSNA